MTEASIKYDQVIRARAPAALHKQIKLAACVGRMPEGELIRRGATRYALDVLLREASRLSKRRSRNAES